MLGRGLRGGSSSPGALGAAWQPPPRLLCSAVPGQAQEPGELGRKDALDEMDPGPQPPWPVDSKFKNWASKFLPGSSDRMCSFSQSLVPTSSNPRAQRGAVCSCRYTTSAGRLLGRNGDRKATFKEKDFHLKTFSLEFC